MTYCHSETPTICKLKQMKKQKRKETTCLSVYAVPRRHCLFRLSLPGWTSRKNKQRKRETKQNRVPVPPPHHHHPRQKIPCRRPRGEALAGRTDEQIGCFSPLRPPPSFSLRLPPLSACGGERLLAPRLAYLIRAGRRRRRYRGRGSTSANLS